MQATAAAAAATAASSLCANAVNTRGIAQQFALVENENRAHTSTVNNQYDGKPLLFTNSERLQLRKLMMWLANVLMYISIFDTDIDIDIDIHLMFCPICDGDQCSN